MKEETHERIAKACFFLALGVKVFLALPFGPVERLNAWFQSTYGPGLAELLLCVALLGVILMYDNLPNERRQEYADAGLGAGPSPWGTRLESWDVGRIARARHKVHDYLLGGDDP